MRIEKVAASQPELSQQAVDIGKAAIKDLFASKGLLDEATSREIEFWSGMIESGSFFKGKWLSDRAHSRPSFSALDHPDGYPT